MSILKVILIVAGCGIIIFILMILSLFLGTTADVSKESPLRSFINTPLHLKRSAAIWKTDKGSYHFVENVLLDEGQQYPGTILIKLNPGTEITIYQFKTYTNKIGSGFTTLFALGTTKGNDGKDISFEYAMGTVGKDFYEDEPFELPLTIWQDNTDAKVKIIRARD